MAPAIALSRLIEVFGGAADLLKKDLTDIVDRFLVLTVCPLA